ncbi:MAG: CAP domain-containing protein [Oscillibacter sp.]|nr:CAP domain-containing protein [Oscillibacter sp.]
MRHLKRDMGMMLTGMALGVLLTGGAVAAGVMAEPSWQNIYVDGRQVQMAAYNIAGNNYVKLRDIGKEVGFNVYWQDGVQVDSSAPYTGEAPAKANSQPTSLAATSLQISSMKGTELTVGERSSLFISPDGTGCTAVSSNLSVASLEQVAGYWVVVPKAPGSATVTVTNAAGESGSLVFTVKTDTSTPAEIDLNASMDIRQEMVRLINEVRQEHGLAALPVNDALMNAAQDCAAHQMRNHSTYEWQVLRNYGWAYGGGFNLTCFNATGPTYVAQTAIFNWGNSPGHFQTIVRETATCLGTGVYLSDGMAYCYMVVGDPSGHSPL